MKLSVVMVGCVLGSLVRGDPGREAHFARANSHVDSVGSYIAFADVWCGESPSPPLLCTLVSAIKKSLNDRQWLVPLEDETEEMYKARIEIGLESIHTATTELQKLIQNESDLRAHYSDKTVPVWNSSPAPTGNKTFKKETGLTEHEYNLYVLVMMVGFAVLWVLYTAVGYGTGWY